MLFSGVTKLNAIPGLQACQSSFGDVLAIAGDALRRYVGSNVTLTSQGESQHRNSEKRLFEQRQQRSERLKTFDKV
jgi:hypothetical protein